jgi:hypothetical protein
LKSMAEPAMPSDSLAMFMSADGSQMLADPSM